jgi:hypothetical protein
MHLQYNNNPSKNSCKTFLLWRRFSTNFFKAFHIKSSPALAKILCDEGFCVWVEENFPRGNVFFHSVIQMSYRIQTLKEFRQNQSHVFDLIKRKEKNALGFMGMLFHYQEEFEDEDTMTALPVMYQGKVHYVYVLFTQKDQKFGAYLADEKRFQDLVKDTQVRFLFLGK